MGFETYKFGNEPNQKWVKILCFSTLLISYKLSCNAKQNMYNPRYSLSPYKACLLTTESLF